MQEVAGVFGTFGALSLLASIAIWALMLRGPLLQRLDGRRASNAHSAALASKVLLVAVGLSAAAAIFAIVGWMFA